MRLRAHVLDAGAGAALFVDWHDVALDLGCRFRPSDDGSWRCLPTGTSAFPTTQFLDASCTDRVGVSPRDRPVPKYATFSEDACASVPAIVHVLATGAELPEGTSLYALDGTTCTAAPATTQRVFRLTPAKPSTFVRARLAVEARGKKLDVELLAGDDGTRQLGRILDHDRGLPCGVHEDADRAIDRAGRCFPSNIAIEGVTTYVAPDCTGRGAWSCLPHCAAPTLALGEVRPDPRSCDVDYQVTALGPRVATPYTGDATTCAPQSINPALCGFYEETTPVDLEELPAIAVGRLGGGRLQSLILTAPGEDRALAEHRLGQLWDNDRAALCVVTDFADGVIRCVTEGTTDITLPEYADPSCTDRIVLGSICAGAPPYATITPDGAINADVVEAVFSVGAPFTGIRRYRTLPSGTGSSCIGVPRGSGKYWHVGARVDPDAVFARVTDRTE